jgi:4-hydroxy-tetrahydrodipicolinate reductase
LGQDAGVIAGTDQIGIQVTDKIDAVPKPNHVIIDFTNPEASIGFLRAAAKSRTPMVIATTGFNPRQYAEIKRLARRTPTLL